MADNELKKEIKNNHSISVSSSGIASTLGEFKKQMTNMDKLLNDIKESTKNAKTIWEGEQSDIIMGSIEEFQNVFEDISKQNQRYVAFLNNVISDYSITDETEIKIVEEHKNAYTINEK